MHSYYIPPHTHPRSHSLHSLSLSLHGAFQLSQFLLLIASDSVYIGNYCRRRPTSYYCYCYYCCCLPASWHFSFSLFPVLSLFVYGSEKETERWG